MTTDTASRYVAGRPNGKYIDVTAITPTPLGEGKTTTSVGPSMRMDACRAGESGVEVAMPKVNIADKFSKITEYWKPYIAAELNGQMVKFDKIKGEFVWHHHDHEDELFLVVKGRFRMDFREDGNEREELSCLERRLRLGAATH